MPVSSTRFYHCLGCNTLVSANHVGLTAGFHKLVPVYAEFYGLAASVRGAVCSNVTAVRLRSTRTTWSPSENKGSRTVPTVRRTTARDVLVLYARFPNGPFGGDIVEMINGSC